MPFHAWTPQAYSTADLGTAAALAAASKIAALAALLVVAQALVGAAVDAGSVTRRPRRAGRRVDAARQRHGAAPGRRPPGCSPGRRSSQAGWVVLPVAALSAAGLRASRRLRARLRGGHGSSPSPRSPSWAPGPLERIRGLLRRDRLTGGRAGLRAARARRPAPGHHRPRRQGRRPAPGRRRRAVAAGARRGRRRRARHRGLPAVVRLLLGAPGRRTPAGRPGRRCRPGPAGRGATARASALGTGMLVLLSALPGAAPRPARPDGTNRHPRRVGADMHKHYNGLKTAALFGGMWALLLVIGWMVAQCLGNSVFLLVFALIGLATTFYGYWNSDKLAIRAMHAYPVSEAEAPVMYRIVSELSTARRQADAPAVHLADPGPERLRDRPQPRERRRLLHRGHPRPARRARAARGARPRAHARLQPRHPHRARSRRPSRASSRRSASSCRSA